MPDRILSHKEVVDVLPFTRVGLYKLRQRGEFPPPIRLSERRIGWRESVIDQWIADREAASGIVPEPETEASA